MSSVSLVTLSGRLLNQNAAQGQEVQASHKLPVSRDDHLAASVAEDQFTPSSISHQGQITAQAAGLFTVQQPPLFSPAANSVIRQGSASTSTQAPAEGQPAVLNSRENTISAAATPQPASPPTTDSTYAQQQLQPLNEALVSLGLNQQDIQKLDQIAAISNNFSPAAFTALAYQMEELAEQASQSASASSTAAAAATQPGQTAAIATSNSEALVTNI